jgi:hypothetical protein
VLVLIRILSSQLSKEKHFEYLQAMTQIQEDVLSACNSLVTNQMDLIEEYLKRA